MFIFRKNRNRVPVPKTDKGKRFFYPFIILS